MKVDDNVLDYFAVMYTKFLSSKEKGLYKSFHHYLKVRINELKIFEKELLNDSRTIISYLQLDIIGKYYEEK